MSLHEKLDRIRTPNLQNQAQTAIVLTALEDILREQKTDFTATAYFSALLSVLNQYISADAILNKELANAVVYLLDLVTPFTPEPLLRAKFAQILTHLAPAITHSEAEAPLLKSSIGCLESLLVVQDATGWQIPVGQIGPKRAVAGLLNLGLDPRPKVRKRALDALTRILQNPPPSPSLDHPATDLCAERSLQTLVEHAKNTPKNGMHDPKTIHALQLVRAVAAARGWPTKRIEPLCEVLLTISRSSNELMTMAALDVFEVIFESLKDEMTSAKLPVILEAISQLRPSQNDSQLLPPWLTVIARGYGVFAEVEPEQAFTQLPSLFAMISTFLESSSYNIRSSSSQCIIALVVNCIPDQILIGPDTKHNIELLERIAETAKGLVNVRYQGAWQEVFDVYEALFDRLRWKAELVLGDIVEAVGELRGNDSFLGKKEADKVLASAIGAMGPRSVLEYLPLNLLHPKPGQPGRAWLLPILRDSVHNTELTHFKEEMIPLFQALFEKVQAHAGKEKTMELKVFETVIQQIWAMFPGYCDLPEDLIEAFDQPFAELFANVLYGQVELRVSICQGLQNLVESNKAVLNVPEIEGHEDIIMQNRITKKTAKKNIDKLASFSTNILLVLFNIYNETLPQYRGYILKCADSYLSITPPSEIAATFNRVTEMLHQSLTSEGAAPKSDKPKKKGTQELPPMSHNLMDLVVTIAPHLGVDNLPILFNVFTAVVNKKEDPQLQKKAYKVISRIVESDVGKTALQQQLVPLQTLLRESKESTSIPARRDRLAALSHVVELLPKSDLTFIFAIMDEVIQAAKEVNEKARAMAFDLLVIMGDKMSKGGIIKRSALEFNEEGVADVEASLEDFVLMVCAGLASPEAHMISATITAITRILYQFKDELKSETIVELVSTMDAFLTSNNREIVRSVLGFVKVAIISLPKEIMLPRLNTLIPNLMTWSHEHKAHFKARVKHIIERMIRRFGYDVIERNVPDEDKKLVINIRKTKERKKRRKEAGEDDEEEGTGVQKRQSKFASEFEEAIYGSESDNSGSDHGEDDNNASSKTTTSSTSRKPKQFIIEDDDEPLDLLDRNALAHISSTKPRSVLRKGQHEPATTKQSTSTATKHKLRITNTDITSDADDDNDMEEPKTAINASTIATGEARDGINAYIQALKGKDAYTRGRGDKIKFSNKRRKEDDDEFSDDDGGVGGGDDDEVMGGTDDANRNAGRGGRGGGGGRGGDRMRGWGGGGRGRGGPSRGGGGQRGGRDRKGSVGDRGGRPNGGGRVQNHRGVLCRGVVVRLVLGGGSCKKCGV